MLVTWICKTIVKSIHNSSTVGTDELAHQLKVVFERQKKAACVTCFTPDQPSKPRPKTIFWHLFLFYHPLILLAGRDQLHPSADGRNSSSEPQLLARRKAAKMLIAVVVMFGICYLPVHLLNILRWVKQMVRGNMSSLLPWVRWSDAHLLTCRGISDRPSDIYRMYKFVPNCSFAI